MNCSVSMVFLFFRLKGPPTTQINHCRQVPQALGGHCLLEVHRAVEPRLQGAVAACACQGSLGTDGRFCHSRNMRADFPRALACCSHVCCARPRSWRSASGELHQSLCGVVDAIFFTEYASKRKEFGEEWFIFRK